jgi:amidase
MRLDEYAAHDALGLAALVAKKQVTPTELAKTASRRSRAVNPAGERRGRDLPDRIESLDERALGNGPFRGVPFLIKDVFGHEAGRKIEFGSRLCRGMVAQQDTYVAQLFRAAGVNIIGRSAAPEYSMSGHHRGRALRQHRRRRGARATPPADRRAAPWRPSDPAWCRSRTAPDIAGSIRIPASYCGGRGA